jgi:glycosyltransferase involved in cell wall biosynthesis
MRVLWLAPWFRTLATLWADGLRDLGHEVRVITTPLHFDPPALTRDDVEISAAWRSYAGLAELSSARAAVRRFAPNVVVAEHLRDPRFLALCPGSVPLVLTTHDAVPHDLANRVPPMRKWSTRWLERRCSVEVTFSDAVARERNGANKHPVVVIPLTSEMPDTLAPMWVDPQQRRDFVVAGRLSAYKNLPLVIAAYRLHQQSSAYRQDRLVIVGDGDPGCDLPDDVIWHRGRFRFADIAPKIAAAKASLCMYSAGSQSGVQLMAMQCGTPSLVSPVGGLAGYLPPGESAVDLDPKRLAAELSRLADPAVAANAGLRNRREYRSRFAVAPTSAAWETVLKGVAARR